jgi:recombination protein RecA
MRPALIVVDSVSAMTPRQVLEGDIDEAGRIGLQAQLMSMFLGYITKDLQPAETCLMFLNQLRAVIKKSKYEGGPDEESSGGNALRYYSSVRLKLKTGTVEKINAKSTITGKDEKKAVNVTVKVTAIKNKIDVPWKSGPMFIRFAEGIDNIQSLIELAVNRNIIKKSGAFFKFSIGDELVFSAQGNEQLREMLKNDNAMFNKLLKNITLKEDIEEKEESKEDVPDSLDTALENVATVYVEKVARKKKAKEEESND